MLPLSNIFLGKCRRLTGPKDDQSRARMRMFCGAPLGYAIDLRPLVRAENANLGASTLTQA